MKILKNTNILAAAVALTFGFCGDLVLAGSTQAYKVNSIQAEDGACLDDLQISNSHPRVGDIVYVSSSPNGSLTFGSSSQA